MQNADHSNGIAKTSFEPSSLVDYGDVSELTQGGTGPAAQPDGAVYSS